MFRAKIASPVSRIDLETLRETIALMRDDIAAVPEYRRIAQALQTGLDEIDRASANQPPRRRAPHAARFVPFRTAPAENLKSRVRPD